MLTPLKQSFKNWLHADPFTQSAAAAYYAIFSFPGLLIIGLSLAGLFFERDWAEQQVLEDVRSLLGTEATHKIHDVINTVQREDTDLWTMVVGAVTLTFGASGLFVQLQRSFNHIWEVEVKKSAGWISFLKSRLISIGLVLVVGFLLLISLSVTTLVTVFREWVSMQISPEVSLAISLCNMALSFLLVVLLFMLMFKILPDAEVPWAEAFLGGTLSTVLFNIGQYALNAYLNWSDPTSAFGAAGSLILLMLWVSYSCMILMLGAEFAKTYAEVKNGKKAKPKDFAKKKRSKE